MNPATIIQLLMAVLGSQTGRDIMRRGMTGESIAKVFTAMRGTPGVAVKAIKPDAVKSFIGGLSANPITATASEGGMGILAKAAGLIKAHPIATAALAIPAIGMMIGRGEDDRRAEQSAMLQQQQMAQQGGGAPAGPTAGMPAAAMAPGSMNIGTPANLEEAVTTAQQLAQQLASLDETSRRRQIAQYRQQNPALADLVVTEMERYRTAVRMQAGDQALASGATGQ